MRRHIALLAAALAIATLAPATGAAELGSLQPGDSRFWPGAYVDTAADGNFVSTDTLVTTDGGYRLRVALDLLPDYKKDKQGNKSEHKSADQGRNFRVALLRGEVGSPDSGVEILSGTNASGPWGYSVELFVCFQTGAGCDPRPHGVPCTGVEAACDELGKPFDCDATSCPVPFTKLAVGPSTGKWTIRVTAEDVDGWSYRMRAGLERPPSPPDELADRYLSPNLRAIPPFELTLNCTSVQGSGAGVRTGVCGDEADAEAGSAGFTGCTPLELAHNPDVRRCLRFSGGEEIAGAQPGSAGDGGGGDLDIEGRDPVDDPLTGDITATAVQIRRAPDGSIDEHTAGQLIFHSAHGHWHYEGFIQYQLFHVTGNTSADSPPTKKIISDRDLGAKRGWNPADERMADWFRFNQGINWAGSAPPPSPNCPLPCTPRLYQTVGWGDFYEWPVEEQFVPIGIEGHPLAVDGHYLLREVVDKEDRLIESDETDNTSYAYFNVTGQRSLKIIERGYGRDPWDPQKVVLP